MPGLVGPVPSRVTCRGLVVPVSDHRRDVARLMEALAIPRDGVLFMHSSFRRLGASGYQAEGFLEALCDYLHRGTVLLPAMSWRLVTPANPVFDELKTPSITGILTELFRRNFATHRSLHPTHSVAGRGQDAAALLGTHHLDVTPCSDRSPTGLLAPHEGHVVLLGVEMDSCTLVHHSEEKFASDIYLRPEIEHYTCRDRSGREIAV